VTWWKSFNQVSPVQPLRFGVEAEGPLDGVFYLTGKPHFDPQTHTFSVEDVDFDMQSRSLLLQSTDRLLHGTIKNKIQEKLNMNLTQRLGQSAVPWSRKRWHSVN